MKDRNSALVEEAGENEKAANAEGAQAKGDSSAANKIKEFLKKALDSGSDAAIASLLDNFTLGNFKEAVYGIWKSEKLDKASEDGLAEAQEALHSQPSYAKSKKQYQEVASRRDDNESADVDPATCMYYAMWWSSKKEKNLLGQLQDLVVAIQKNAKAQEDDMKAAAAKVKSMKVKGVGDAEMEAFGPIISNMVKDGKSAKEIEKRVAELKAQVNESYRRLAWAWSGRQAVSESRAVWSESVQSGLALEAVAQSDAFLEAVARQLCENEIYAPDGMLDEGFLDKAKDLAKKAAGKATSLGKKAGAAAWSVLPDKAKQKLKDTSSKAVKFVQDGGLAPILKIAGLGTLALSGGAGIALVIGTMMLIDKHGKQLKAAMDYAWTSYANSKGRITSMSFSIKGKPDLKYRAAFYAKDKCWRVTNLSNKNKHPTKDFIKAVITGEVGKKYVDRVIELWDPVFSPDKGGKIAFAEMLKQSKDLNLDEKQAKALDEFKDQYVDFKAGILKPAIDTRTQSLK